MNEERARYKTELKMFLWYLITEPFRQLSRTARKIDSWITPETLSYFYLIFAFAIFIKNWKDYRWMLGMFIVIIIWIRSMWIRRKFIRIYREKHYPNISSDIQPPATK